MKTTLMPGELDSREASQEERRSLCLGNDGGLVGYPVERGDSSLYETQDGPYFPPDSLDLSRFK